MNSKINGVAGGSPRLTNESKVDRTPPEAEAGAAPAGSRDEVNLTDTAQLMVRLTDTLKTLPPIDSQRVETVKQAIADGTYSVDAQRVATEVLRMELGLKLR